MLTVACGLAVATVYSSVGPPPAGDRPVASSGGSSTSSPGSGPVSEPPSMAVAGPDAPTTVVPGTVPVDLAAATSAALFERAPVAVLVADGDPDARARAAEEAERRGAPLLLVPATPGEADGSSTSPTSTAATPPVSGDAVAAELERLGTDAVLA